MASTSKQSPQEEQEKAAAPESPLDHERILNRFLTLRARARRLRREAEEAEKEAEALQKEHPLLGNVVGLIQKAGEPEEKKAKRKAKHPPKEEKKAQKKARREAQVAPGRSDITMTEAEIRREGGEVEPRGFFQHGRLHRD